MTSLKSLLGLPLDRALRILADEGRAPNVLLTAPPAREGARIAPVSGTRCVVASRGEDTLIAADFKIDLKEAPAKEGGDSSF